MTRVHNSEGIRLAATFDVEVLDDELSLVMASAGGTSGSSVSRNADYALGLEVLLRRLAELRATIKDAYVDSSRVKRLPLEERRLEISGSRFPIRLVDLDDYETFRKRLTRAQKSIGRSPGDTRPGGNERRRIRLSLAIPGFLPTLESAERLALVLSNSTTPPDANSDSREALAENAHSGQGFITDTATKLAIEEAAMRAAIAHYSALHWEVEDVSRTASYDIHCTRGREELRVEVKGTTGLATAVLLTPNEVSHALENAGRVALYVLSSIETSMQDGVVFATGGIPQIREPWELDIRQLSPTGYSYSL